MNMIDEGKGAARQVASADKLIDILEAAGNGTFVTFCNVSAAKLQKNGVGINPATNRKIKVVDYDAITQGLGTQAKVAGIIKLTTTYFHYSQAEHINKKYAEWARQRDDVRKKYGVYTEKEPWEKKPGYKEVSNGVAVGNTENTRGRLYSPQNLKGSSSKTTYYAVDADGNIIREVTDVELEQFLEPKSAQYDAGYRALQKLGADEETLEAFRKDFSLIDTMSYHNFILSSLLYIVASTKKTGKLFFINDALSDLFGTVKVNPREFIAIANKRYEEDYRKMDSILS